MTSPAIARHAYHHFVRLFIAAPSYVRQNCVIRAQQNPTELTRTRFVRWRTDNGEACSHIAFRSSGGETSVCHPRSPTYHSRRRNRQPVPHWRHTVNSRAPATQTTTPDSSSVAIHATNASAQKKAQVQILRRIVVAAQRLWCPLHLL